MWPLGSYPCWWVFVRQARRMLMDGTAVMLTQQFNAATAQRRITWVMRLAAWGFMRGHACIWDRHAWHAWHSPCTAVLFLAVCVTHWRVMTGPRPSPAHPGREHPLDQPEVLVKQLEAVAIRDQGPGQGRQISTCRCNMFCYVAVECCFEKART